MSDRRPVVGLFVTCLVDLFRPRIGFAAAALLERAGCRVEVPVQTCCGQPAHNGGDRMNAQAIARSVIEAFWPYDYLVAPSGSCAGMIRVHYPTLFADEPAARARAEDLARRTYELTQFLVDVRGLSALDARFEGTATYHDSCSGLRELRVKEQPRRLLAMIGGLAMKELPGADECCGFGGAFCVKYPEISARIVTEKTASIAATGAGTLLAGDLGCLMNIAGKLSREGRDVAVRHVAEVLIGDLGPAIGESERG